MFEQLFCYTHIFESIFAQLAEEAQEAERREPCPPEQHLVHVLNVQDTKDKDKFVKDKIPELIL